MCSYSECLNFIIFQKSFPMKRYYFSICLLFFTTQQIWSQWTHVGPTKSSTSGLYENGRIDLIVPHPNYNGTTNQTIYAGGVGGGLWVTTNDGVAWNNIATTSLYYSGISGFDIDATGTYLYAADINVVNYHVRQSRGVFRYTISTDTWVATGAFPPSPLLLSLGLPLKINQVKIHPVNSQIIFACTNGGIYRTTNGGTSWSLSDATAEFENVAFMPTTGGNFDVYASGNNQFKFSTNNGASFQVVAGNPFSAYDNVYTDLGYAYDNVNNKHIIYLFGRADKATTFPINYPNSSGTIAYILYKFTKDGAGTTSITQILTYKDSDPNNDRLLVYGNKDVVYIGGDGLRKYNFITNAFYKAGTNGIDDLIPTGSYPGYGGTIHPDLHDIKIIEVGTIHKVLAATDGGFYINNFTANSSAVYTNTWVERNNGMDISQIWGFSSSETEPNFYITSEADTKGFVFDIDNTNPASPLTLCQHTWGIEPICALIDKKGWNNGQYLILGNSYQKSSDLFVSNSRGNQFTYYGESFGTGCPISSAFFSAKPTTPFEADKPNNPQQCIVGASINRLYQDPVRLNNIYSMEKGFYQYDRTKDAFALKYATGKFTTATNPFRKDNGWISRASGFAFSPTDENKSYFTAFGFSPDIDPVDNSLSHIYRYNANLNGTTVNYSDSWGGHNENQWEIITPNLTTELGLSFNQTNDIYKYDYIAIAVSDWDPNKIWVACSPIPNNPLVKILMFNGTNWTDYSLNIPANEEIISMIYERGSNDGLYVGTNRAVYYRNASMVNGWTVYSNNDLPHLFMVQININYKENTIRSGTFGRGIWKSNLYCPSNNLAKTNCNNCHIPSDTFWEGNQVSINNTQINTGKLIVRGVKSITILPAGATNRSRLDSNGNVNNYYKLFIHGCGPGQGNTF